jgi:hypothetical protein
MKYKIFKIKDKKSPRGYYFKPKKKKFGIWFSCGRKFYSKAKAIRSIMDNKDNNVSFEE